MPELRQATRDDIAAIWVVRYAVTENTLAPGVIGDEACRAQIEDSGRGWVVDDGDRTIAFAIGNADDGNVWALFVLPQAQGRGHGARLHDTVVDWLWSRGLQALWLTTGAHTRARAFYAARGWRVAGTAPHGQVRMELQRPLFGAGEHVARELSAIDLPALQALFDATSGYFERVTGAPPRRDEAQSAFDERPPPHLRYARQATIGCWRGAALEGVVIASTDFTATGVWHIALFLVAAALHGSGVAQQLHAALQAWATDGGARWLRLAVVAGNTPAERFWLRNGYVEVRRRPLGRLGRPGSHMSRVLVKPLTDAGCDDYLRRVPRDHPDSTLP